MPHLCGFCGAEEVRIPRLESHVPSWVLEQIHGDWVWWCPLDDSYTTYHTEGAAGA